MDTPQKKTWLAVSILLTICKTIWKTVNKSAKQPEVVSASWSIRLLAVFSRVMDHLKMKTRDC